MKAFKKLGMIVSVCCAFTFAFMVTSHAWADGKFSLPQEKPVPQDVREFFVDESKLPFAGFPGRPATQSWGIDKDAGYRIEIPDNWNGDLVMCPRGFRGEGLELTVDSPPLRLH